MAFNILKWILRKDETDKTGAEVTVGDFLDMDSQSAMVGLELYLSRMAFWSIVRKIGSAVAAVEWQTFRRGKKVKAKEYWSWNHSPNPNQTRDEFFQKLIGQLFSEQEALVVETRDGSRYVADAFSKTEHLSGNIYQDINVNGENVPGVFHSRDVLHLEIGGERIKRILIAIAAAEGKLMKSTVQGYLRTQGTHGILKIDDTAEADPDFDETYGDLVNEKFKKYLTSENAVLPLFNGYEFSEHENAGGSTKANITGTRDIRNMIDDIVELTAQAMGVPVSIATGKNVTDADFKAFMTYTVQPLVKMIQGEINRKIYGSSLVFSGTYIAADFAGVRYTDLFDVAVPIDKLIGSGAFCINDIRTRLGLDVIDEPWAWQHWMTKNYSSVEDLLVGVDEEPASQPEKREEQTNEQTTETQDDDSGGSGE